MSYPFVQKIKNTENASYKLKILSVAMKRPISAVIIKAVDGIFEKYDRKEIQEAILKLGKPKHIERIGNI